jgi:ABC-type multidrug transport system ATPase subunit
MVKITCSRCYFSYPDIKENILNDITITFNPGEIVAIVGKNGSGKSTFLKILSGIISPNKGTIYYDNVLLNGIKSVKNFVTILPENAKLFLIGPTVQEELFHYSTKKEDIFNLLKSYHLENLLQKKIYSMSEGQRRIIAVLSNLYQKKSVYLLDEPTVGLDSKGRENLIKMFKEIKFNGGIVIIATNDNRILSSVDRIVGLKNGNITIDESPKTGLIKLQKTTGIIPNQISRLTGDLINNGFELPNIITADELNFYLRSKE